MLPVDQYETYIFDCDGVILNSNKLKIDAMKLALQEAKVVGDLMEKCLLYFKNNFGTSRFSHVEMFVNNILDVPEKEKREFSETILNAYSAQCKKLYLRAEITPGFIEFIHRLAGEKYIASGSEQTELREVFNTRRLDTHFDEIYGSPEKKTNIVNNILNLKPTASKTVFFGDAVSDLQAAFDNNIDFIAYLPFSNVAPVLVEKAKQYNFRMINSWDELL